MDPADELPSIWQEPDPAMAEQRVRELERHVATLRAKLDPLAEIPLELEDVLSDLALARIDLDHHRRAAAHPPRGSDAAP